MAGDPTVTVKRQFAAALRPLMPQVVNTRVPVSYAHPGPDFLGVEHVYFDGRQTTIERHAMRSGRLRRIYTVRFDVVCYVLRQGPTTADPANLALFPQSLADERADALCQIVDEFVADEQHLASPEIVDQAWTESSALTYGYLDNGVASQNVLRVAFRCRPL